MANDRKVLSVGIEVDGADKARKALESMGDAGAAAARKVETAFAKTGIGQNLIAQATRVKTAFAEVSSSFGRLNESFAGVKSAATTFGNGIANVQTGLGRLATTVGVVTVAIGGLFAGLSKIATSAADTAESLEKQAAAFGLSFEQAQRLNAVIKEVGGDQALLERALTKFTSGLNGQSEASTNAQDKLNDLRKEWQQAADNAGSYAERLKVNAKYSAEVEKQTKKLVKEQGDFNGVTKDGLPGLIEYANRLTSMGDAQAQLTQVTKDFGARGAVDLLAFLTSLRAEFDGTTNAALKMLPPLDKIGQTKLKDLDTAGDRLSTNFDRLRLLVGAELAPAFTALFDVIREGIGTVGPQVAQSLGGIAQQLTQLIVANKDSIVAFIKEMGDRFVSLAKSVQQALASLSAGDTNNWITQLKDNVVGTVTIIENIITGVLIPAFQTIATALEPVARAINALFGTEFTGASLAAAAAILQVSGGFTILLGGAKMLFAPLKAVFYLIKDGRLWALAAIDVVTKLGVALRAAAGFMIALIASNPALAALVATLVVVGGGLAILATRQTEAEKAAAAHAQSLQDLKAIQSELDAGIEGSTQKLEDWKNAQLAAGAAAIQLAESQLAVAQTNFDKLVFETGQIGEEWLYNSTQIKQAADNLRTLSNNLSEAKRRLAEQMVAYEDAKAGADKLAQSSKNVADQAARAAGESGKLADGFKRIMVRGPGGFEKAFDVPTDKLIQAQLETKRLEEALAAPGQSNTILDQARTKADQFMTQIKAVAAEYNAVIAQLDTVTTTLQTNFDVAFETMAAKAEATAARIKAALTSIPQVTGADQAAQAVDPATVVGPFQDAAVQIAAIWSELSTTITSTMSDITTNMIDTWASSLPILSQIANDTVVSINSAFATIGTDGIAATLGSLGEVFTNIARNIVTQWAAAMRNVVDNTQSMAQAVVSLIGRLRQALAQMIAAIRQAKAEASGKADGGLVGSPRGFASGGRVYGPGTATSDSIPAWLSAGEFVIRAKAVTRQTLPLLYALNSGRLSMKDIAERIGFANGGMVQALAGAFTPSFAGASIPQARGDTMRPAVINIGGQVVEGGMFPASALAQLGKAAQMARLSSGGRRPAWSK